jgi:hypothetical protein
MNAHPRHPGTEELADFQAGMTDAARGDQLAAHIAECPECASVAERLSQVSAMLASIPPPAMPDGIEDRIMGALAVEAARRNSAGVDSVALATSASVPSPAPSSTVASLIGPSASTPPSDSPAPASPVLPLPVGVPSLVAARRRAWRRQSMTAPLGVLVAAAACLMLAFVGYRLSGTGHPATSSAVGGGASSQNSRGNAQAGGAPGTRRHTFNPPADTSMGPTTVSFVVLVSRTNFQKATLRAQVIQQMAAPQNTDPAASPGSSVSTGPGGPLTPSAQLIGCVKHLLGSTRPVLVEEASYQSLPVYVIAIPNRVWVVARSATAADPEVLASATLPHGR